MLLLLLEIKELGLELSRKHRLHFALLKATSSVSLLKCSRFQTVDEVNASLFLHSFSVWMLVAGTILIVGLVSFTVNTLSCCTKPVSHGRNNTTHSRHPEKHFTDNMLHIVAMFGEQGESSTFLAGIMTPVSSAVTFGIRTVSWQM